MSNHFDAIVIGAGQAGPALAGRLSGVGMTVAVIERALVGGTCVNTGCMPTKTMIASARAARFVQRAGEYGIRLGAPAAVDMATVKARVDKVVADARHGLEHWIAGMPGCTLVRGHARFESATDVRVGAGLFTAPRIFVNVGGRASVPDMPGLADVRTFTNAGMLELAEVPRHLVVIGGSYVGLEFAQAFRRFGAEVTIVERAQALVSREDADVSAAIRAILEAEGIAMRLAADCIGFRPAADGDVAVSVDCRDGDPEVIASHVLLAIGRRPNTDDLGLERAGVAVDARGYIPVDGQLRTRMPGIWALGECNGRGAFTHTAYDDFEIVAADLLDGERRNADARVGCYALYIDPPLGRVGLTETQARAAGHRVRVGMRPMTRVGRAVENGETQGLMKIVVDATNDAILGAAVLGPGGDESIQTVLEAMAAGRTASDLRRTMHIHPTVSELWPTVAGELTVS